MNKFQEEILTHIDIHFDFLDRIRILFNGTAFVDVKTKTEKLPGYVISESKAWAKRIFPKKKMGEGIETQFKEGENDRQKTA